MNDFTKEELIKLKNGIDYLPNSVNMSTQYLADCVVIMQKLDKLIANYCDPECDHRSNGNYYLNGKITTIPTEEYKCKYCDKLYKCIFKNGSCVGYEELNEIAIL